MDRITRKELKQDKFALEVGQTVEYVSEHRRQLIRYGTVAVALIVVVSVFLTWRRHQTAARRQALASVLEIQQAAVGAPVGDAGKVYSTEQEKTKAEVAGFTEVAAKYAGSEEGSIAEYYLGATAAEQGNYKAAEQWLKDVADSSYANYGSLAKLALADVYQSEGKTAEGERLLRSLVAKPTDFVSKEHATIALARLIAPQRPAEARKLLEPLLTARGAISRAVVSELGALPKQ